MFDGREHQTCGSRTLNDDFLDTHDTLFINGGKGPRISEGLDQSTVPAPPNSAKPQGATGIQATSIMKEALMKLQRGTETPGSSKLGRPGKSRGEVQNFATVHQLNKEQENQVREILMNLVARRMPSDTSRN